MHKILTHLKMIDESWNSLEGNNLMELFGILAKFNILDLLIMKEIPTIQIKMKLNLY